MSQKSAFVFPGQGSQSVGMGHEWAEYDSTVRECFEEADDALGFSLSLLCWEGPEKDLQLTANTQPAILATSVAIWRVLNNAGLTPAVMAGHSLGEYSALVAAGCLSFADALILVRRRGELMQEAVPVGEGAMAAILGLEASQVAEIATEAAENQVCSVANLNAPAQTVIAGHRAAVERAVVMAEEGGARRAILLPLSAPFHSPLMAPARVGLTPYLEEVSFVDFLTPVVNNVEAAPIASGELARDGLIRQIDSPVRWVESVQWMSREAGADLFVEVGPGMVLTGLTRRIAPDAQTVSLSRPSGLDKLEKKLEGAN